MVPNQGPPPGPMQQAPPRRPPPGTAWSVDPICELDFQSKRFTTGLAVCDRRQRISMEASGDVTEDVRVEVARGRRGSMTVTSLMEFYENGALYITGTIGGRQPPTLRMSGTIYARDTDTDSDSTPASDDAHDATDGRRRVCQGCNRSRSRSPHGLAHSCSPCG